MSVPETNLHPPFRFLRASHAIFTSRDLAKSREFYTEVLGLLVSDEDKDTLYMRGLEERAHHSLAIKRTREEPACLRVGMRVQDEDELERAKRTFEQHGLPCRWADEPFQGRALHTVDVVGTPLEIVASMPHQPRRDTQVHMYKGAASRRFDHYQVTVPDVHKAAVFYTSLGFRIADYMTMGEHPVGVFLHVKNTPYDLVFLERDGPALHHYGYIVSDVQSCCVLATSWASSAGVRTWSLARASTPSAIPTTSICSIQTATGWSCSSRRSSTWTLTTRR
jgi:catechol 2,3-dioxygenase